MSFLKKIFFAAVLALFIIMNLVYLGLPGLGLSVVKLQFAFSAERATTILDLWGAAGQKLFVSTIYLDYLFPVFYGGLLFLWGRSKLAKGAAIAAALSDMAENTLHVLIIQGIFSLDSGAVLAASLCASLKWLCILYIFGSLLVARKSPDKHQ